MKILRSAATYEFKIFEASSGNKTSRRCRSLRRVSLTLKSGLSVLRILRNAEKMRTFCGAINKATETQFLNLN